MEDELEARTPLTPTAPTRNPSFPFLPPSLPPSLSTCLSSSALVLATMPAAFSSMGNTYQPLPPSLPPSLHSSLPRYLLIELCPYLGHDARRLL